MKQNLRILVCAVFLTVPSSLWAQARLTGGDLTGVITDASGGVLPGAAVTATNTETNVARSVVTDMAGRYVIAALPPGTYSLKVEMPGFTIRTRAGIVMTLGQTIAIDLRLEVGATSEELTVTAEAPLMPVARTEVSSVVTQKYIDNLPINGRSFISFSVITPGVSTDRTPQQGASATSGLSFTGQRARSNNIMVDGLDNNDPVVGAVRAVFSQEAVREFQVLADSYSAEFGKASGGVVNIVTKSGTNELRGNAFYYFRDKNLNAKNYFDKYDIFGNPINLDKAPYSQNQWGGTAGGPIAKNRTFFFAAFERTDIGDSRLVTIDKTAASLLNSLGFPVETGNVPADTSNTEVLVKADHQWSPNHSIVIRGNGADINRDGIDDFGGIVARSRGTEQLRTDWALAASQTDVFSARWLNEFRTQFAHEKQDIQSLDPTCGGPCVAENQGGPTLEVTGVASVGRQRFTPQPRKNNRIQLMDTVSYLAGTHQMKMGAEYNRIAGPADHNGLPLHFGGRYIFSAIPQLGLNSALDALRLGIPAAYVQGYGTSSIDLPTQDLSLFVQDEWKARRLTVKPGLRYQRQMWGDFNYQVSDVGGTTFSYPMPRDNNNLAPRIAAAYDVKGDGRTSLHGSYGMFFENTYTTVASVTEIVNGRSDGVRTLVLAAPRASIAWNAPGRRLTEAQASAILGATTYPSTVISLDPNMKTGYAHQASVGIDQAIGSNVSLAVNGVIVRGYNQPGTIDYNPVLPSVLGPSRRPNDLPCSANPVATCVNGGIPGTSASVLQYTSFARTWYKGLTVSLTKRATERHQLMVSYTLSKSDDTSTDYQSNFIVQNNGRGRNSADKYRAPDWVRSEFGARPVDAGPAASSRRVRRVPPARRGAAVRHPDGCVGPSVLAARRCGPERRRQRRRVPVGSRAPEPGRRSDERRPQQREHRSATHRGHQGQPAFPDGESRRLRGDPRRVQPVQHHELLRRHEPVVVHDFWNGRVPVESAANLWQVHADAVAAPGAAGGKDHVLGVISLPPARFG